MFLPHYSPYNGSKDFVDDATYQHVAQYVTDLRTLTGYYIGWVPNRYADTPSADPENAFEIITTDPAIQHAMNMLSIWVGGEYFDLWGPDILRITGTRALNNIGDFGHARRSIAYGGILFGIGIQKTYWRNVCWKDFPGLVWEVPYAIREVDRRRMRIERDNRDRSHTWWTIWSPQHDRYIILRDRNLWPEYPQDYQLQNYMWFTSDVEETFPYGRGYAEVLFPLAYIKAKAQQYWAELAESWAKPFFVMMADSDFGSFDASLGSGYQTEADRVAKLLDVLENSRGRHQIVLDKNDELKVYEHGAQSKNVIQDLMNYLDKRINLVVLGTELVSESGGGFGSYAMAQVHRGSTNSIVKYHRNRVESVIEQQLLREFYYRNRFNLARLGHSIPKPGEYKFNIRVESEVYKQKILSDSDSAGAARIASEI